MSVVENLIKIIEVEPDSELARLLDEADKGEIQLLRDGMSYRLAREAGDIWAGYDPEKARAGMRAAAGAWKDIDAEALKEYIYRAREEGSRPPQRP